MRSAAVSVLGIFAAIVAAASFAEAMEVHGYNKDFMTLFDRTAPAGAPSGDVYSPMASLLDRLRLEATLAPLQGVRLEVAYDISMLIQDERLFGVPTDYGKPEIYRIADLRKRLHPAPGEEPVDFAVYQNLDRLRIDIDLGPLDLTIGRQAIAWGSARGINPTDIVSPFLPNELDIEDRPGVDAIRLRIPTEAMGEVDFGYVAGKDAGIDASAVFLRYRFTPGGEDATILLASFRENLLVGADVAGSLGGAGYWLELAWASMDGSSHSGGRWDYLRYSVGCDYSPVSGLYAFVEYHFNGAGTAEPSRYLSRAASPAFTEGAVYLVGRHYIAGGIGWDVSPLDRMDLQAIANVTDPSLFAALRLDHSLSEDVYLEAGAMLGSGEAPGLESTDGREALLVPRSEFGYIPDLYFLSLRVYY